MTPATIARRASNAAAQRRRRRRMREGIVRVVVELPDAAAEIAAEAEGMPVEAWAQHVLTAALDSDAARQR